MSTPLDELRSALDGAATLTVGNSDLMRIVIAARRVVEDPALGAAPDLLSACKLANRYLADMAAGVTARSGIDKINDWSTTQQALAKAILKARKDRT